MNNGQTFTLKDFPEDIAGIIETSGANGATHRLAAVMDALIDDLEAKGELDTAQAGQLRELANQGHKIGTMQQQIADLVKQSGNWGTFTGLPVTHEGQTMTAEQYLYMTAWNGPTLAQVADPLEHPHKSGKEMAAFIQLYQQAKGSGALANPGVKAVITALATDIALVSESYEHALGAVHNFSNPDGQTAHQLTHSDSLQICRTGKGKDSGVKCL